MNVPIIAALSLLILAVLLKNARRRKDFDSLISELRRFDQEQLGLMAKQWKATRESIAVNRKDLKAVIGGPRGFLDMRKNAAVILRMLEFFPEPIDGPADDPELQELITGIMQRALEVRKTAGAAMLESIALPLFKVPYHGMQAVYEYHLLVGLFYQVVMLTQPKMVEKLEFVI
jgi:hypothetical protein